MRLTEQQATGTWRSIWQIQRVPTTGVEDVGEGVRMSDGTWEVLISLLLEHARGVSKAQVLTTQGQRDGGKDGGPDCSSEEVG